MQAVILAGGLGTRMLPATESVPKILLEVAGRPFAAWLLEKLASHGFTEVVMCIGHLGERVEEALGNGSAFDLSIAYARDGERLLGTAGALRRALPLLAPTFLVTYGDSYLPFDYQAPLRDLEAHPEAEGAMAVFHNHDRIEPSNTAVQGAWVTRYDKARLPSPIVLDHIDYGATALKRSVVEALPQDLVMGLDAVQSRLAHEHRLLATPANERFFEIGSLDGRAALEARLRDRA